MPILEPEDFNADGTTCDVVEFVFDLNFVCLRDLKPYIYIPV